MANLADPSSDAWYVTAFGEDYSQVYLHRDDASAEREVDALIGLMGLRAGMTVLDVCCGAGRHAAAMARRGMDVTGLDLSEALLAEAGRRPELEGRLVRSDVREVPFTERFDAVTNLFTSFGYFDDDADNALALNRMAGALRRGGRLVMDHANRRCVEATLVPEDEREVNGRRLISRRRIENDRVIKDMTLELEDGSVREMSERVRLFWPDEIGTMFDAAGVVVDGVYGTFDGGELTEQSDRMIVLGTRR